MIINPTRRELLLDPNGFVSHRYEVYLEELTRRVNNLNKDRIVSVDNTDSPYTIVDDVEVVVTDPTSGNVTVNLPAVALSEGRRIRVFRMSASNVVTIDGNASENINGATTQVIATTIYDSKLVICTGTEWLMTPL